MKNIIARSRAPLRLGFAGGGTDVSPYCDKHIGCVLNATINLYANCSVELLQSGDSIHFEALDIGIVEIESLQPQISIDGPLKIHRAVYNRVVRDFNGGEPMAVRIFTSSDAPPGSGLGTSSTLTVSILAAFTELLLLPLGEYDLAHLAYEIERIDCGLAGGKQDQYAATFGGFNFMEFYKDNRVIVNPLRIRRRTQLELESSLLLYFTGQSRESAQIIADQVEAASSTSGSNTKSINAMHQVKALAYEMKEAILKGDVNNFHQKLGASWIAKKQMADTITNQSIEELSGRLFDAGVKAVKITGAGGGGFMMISVEPILRNKAKKTLSESGGKFHNFNFVDYGVETWRSF